MLRNYRKRVQQHAKMNFSGGGGRSQGACIEVGKIRAHLSMCIYAFFADGIECLFASAAHEQS